MRRLMHLLAGVGGGYVAGVAAAIALVSLFSSNTHDRSLEAAMTAFFVVGPLGAIIGAVFVLLRSKR